MTGEVSEAGDIPGKRSLRPLGGVLAAMAVSLTGTRISVVAVPWFVLVTTGSATQTGLVAFCEMTPYVVVKAFTGPLVDRIGPRVVSWTTDLASASAAVAVPLLHSLDLLSFPLLLVLVALIGAARGPGDLAKEVMVPEAAERGGVPLERATGLSGVTDRLASTVGLAAGGSLVALLGPLTALAVDAGLFVLGSAIIGLALPRGMGHAAEEPPSPAERSEPGYWQRFGEGFTFLRGEPLLLTVIVMVGITNLLDAAISSVLVPVWVKESGNGPAAIGLMGSVMGAAGVGGSLIAATVAHRLRRRTVVLTGFLLAGAPRFLILALDAPLGVVLAVFAGQRVRRRLRQSGAGRRPRRAGAASHAGPGQRARRLAGLGRYPPRRAAGRRGGDRCRTRAGAARLWCRVRPHHEPGRPAAGMAPDRPDAWARRPEAAAGARRLTGQCRRGDMTARPPAPRTW